MASRPSAGCLDRGGRVGAGLRRPALRPALRPPRDRPALRQPVGRAARRHRVSPAGKSQVRAPCSTGLSSNVLDRDHNASLGPSRCPHTLRPPEVEEATIGPWSGAPRHSKQSPWPPQRALPATATEAATWTRLAAFPDIQRWSPSVERELPPDELEGLALSDEEQRACLASTPLVTRAFSLWRRMR